MPVTLLFTLALVIDEIVHRDLVVFAEWLADDVDHDYDHRPNYHPFFSIMMRALVHRTPLYYDNDPAYHEFGMTGWYSDIPYWRLHQFDN